MSLPIEKSMTLSSLQELVLQHIMDRSFEDYNMGDEGNKYTKCAKALFDLACDELPRGQSIRAVLIATKLATPSLKISKKGKRFLWIAYGGRL